MSTHLKIFARIAVAGILCTSLPMLRIASAADTPGLGDDKTTAVEVCKPPGERAYLSRLLCPDGSTPSYSRVGSFGNRNDTPKNLTEEQESALLNDITSGAPLKPGEIDYHVVDKFEVSCGSSQRFIYMDMYHCDKAAPSEAPTGFKLRSSP